MVNCSLREGLVPDGFKKAVVTPLIKKASLPVEEVKNYRPVSGLSLISKLVERVVFKKLVDHIHRHGLDNSYQSAYRSGHSTETALLSIKNDIHLSLSRSEATALVLQDLSAAFDTIDHSTLLSCLLDWFCVGGSALKWFSSYLAERYQSVKIHPTESVRNLGVWFDSDFSFSKHIQNVCKGCFSQLRDFRNIRQFLTQDAAVSVANAFVSIRLDYCNSLFRSLSKVNLHRLQSIQNSAARIVTNSCKYTRITPVPRKLLWLPIQFTQSSNWLPWCTSLFILVSVNISLHIYPHTTLLTILDVVRMLPISSMYQNFNLQFTSPLSSLA